MSELLARLLGDTPALPTLSNLRDPRTWLEDVEGSSQLAFAREKNAAAVAALGEPTQDPTYGRILSILDSKDKIPYVGRVLNGLYYNFWQDASRVRGVWQRCTLAQYRVEQPAWEVVLDLDALSKEEGVTWVWGGSVLLDEGPDARADRVLIKLSRGGADAKEVREFDLDAKKFVAPAEGGFFLPEAKVQVCYKGRDTLLVGGDFFGKDALTDSGYPRTVHEWKRGTPLADAPRLYAGEKGDVSVGGWFAQRESNSQPPDPARPAC